MTKSVCKWVQSNYYYKLDINEIENIKSMRRKHVRDYVADSSVEGGYRYIGEYYIDKNVPEYRKKIGNRSLVFAVIAMIIALIALSINWIGIRTIYVVIPLEVFMICMFIFILGAWTYKKSDVKMEKRHYEDSIQRMVHSSMIAFFMNLCSIIGQFYIVFKGYHFLEMYLEYIFLGVLIVLGIISFDLWSISRKLIAQVINEGH